MKKLFLVLSAFFISYLTFSQDIPKCKGYVSDYESLFTAEQNSNITRILSDYEKETSIQIFILTVPEFESDIADFAQNTFTNWKIGQRGVDNGLLIVISKNKRIFRSHPGYGLEGYLPDAWIKHTGDSIGIKYAGQYYDGVLMYINQIKERIGSEYSKDNNEKLINSSNTYEKEINITDLIKKIPWYFWVIIIVAWFILLLIKPDAALWILYIFILSGKNGGSGGSGGGGNSGGGGSNSKW